MFLLDWLYGALSSMGLLKKKAKHRIVFLCRNHGQLESGKDWRVIQSKQTQQPNSGTTLTIGNVNFTPVDLGGDDMARRVWKAYYAIVDGVLYMADANATERFEESVKELEALLSSELDAPRSEESGLLRYPPPLFSDQHILV
ncbi:putative small GTPase superfamily, ARF/SAR type, P-loop containing nucleoside triphosphate hydrolase [Rosa chinensis]|uniref:Putative small GTPase superfamily, ARF/SAR type, P-loop containing nucleoside triphosphate hydrolase n=1 Tax=Rosa chinensis TaxID=74649 RepID=A0A2P6QZ39_ROSCH|nr:putative small GTPase superfamily, ARF/SAR type, P-loop containing nucleoside triphosphate hydrolase [Rosa chinensis]